MKFVDSRIRALEGALVATARYAPPVVVDVAGLSTADAAARIAAAQVDVPPRP